MTLPQAAKYLKCSRQWAYQLYKQGKFPNAEIIGSFIVIPIDDVMAFINSKETLQPDGAGASADRIENRIES